MVVPFSKPVMAGCLDDDSNPFVWTSWLDIKNPTDLDSSRVQLTIDIENSQIIIVDTDINNNYFTKDLHFRAVFTLPDYESSSFDFTIYADSSSACTVSDPDVDDNLQTASQTNDYQIMLP